MARKKPANYTPTGDETLRYNLRLRIYKTDKVFGPGVAQLMRLVDETGSLSEACRRMDMAYSKGWKIMKRSEEDLGFALMQGSRGGENGGQTALTEEGRDILRRYQEMQAELKEQADALFERHFGDLMGEQRGI